MATTPGLAFLAGYHAALRRLWPVAPEGVGALCATENRKLRPADMQTRLLGLQVSGRKDFVIAGPAASWLLVPARDEAPGERPWLSLYVVRCGERGVVVEAGPALLLVPGIPHGRLYLESATCRADPWAAMVGAITLSVQDPGRPARADRAGQLALRIGLEVGWPQRLQLQLAGILAGAAEVSRLSPVEAATHLLLESLSLQFNTLAGDIDVALAHGSAQWLQLWQRDRGVLHLARAAQAKRLDQAAAVFGLTAEGDAAG